MFIRKAEAAFPSFSSLESELSLLSLFLACLHSYSSTDDIRTNDRKSNRSALVNFKRFLGIANARGTTGNVPIDRQSTLRGPSVTASQL